MSDQQLLAETRNYILDQVPEAIFTIGVDGKITHFNDACLRLAGRTPLIGKDAWCAMWKIFDENGVEVAPEASAVATSLRTATPIRGGELTGERPDGSRFQFLYHTTPLYDEGELAGSLALLIDITAQKEAQTRLKQLKGEVTYLSRVAAMGVVASALAHELSQPLTAAMNYIRTSQRLSEDLVKDVPAEVQAALQATEAAITRASDTLKSVRNMVQRQPVERKVTSLTGLVEELVPLLPRALPLEFRIDADADRLFADKMQIEQVLFNLLRNASEAIEGRSDGKIVLEARRIGKMAEICVTDNGSGVPAEAREHLFSPFRSSKPDGLGIGLSVCRAIVEQHQGQIWLASGGSDARFCFTIPIAPSHNPGVVEAA